MKVVPRIVLPLIVIVTVLLFLFIKSPATKQDLSNVVVSEDGSLELADFYRALSTGEYEQAANYIQKGCTDKYCFVEDKTEYEVVEYLRDMCETHVCDPIEAEDVTVEYREYLYSHSNVFLDENGERKRLCLSADCRVQKVSFISRVKNVEGQWFVVDPPPIRY